MLLFTVPILTLIILYLLKLSLNIHHTCMFGQFSININTYLVIIWNNNPSEPKMFTLVHRKRAEVTSQRFVCQRLECGMII